MIGSHMVEIFHGQGERVLGSYYRPTTDISELDPAIPMRECDMRDHAGVERLIQEWMPDEIYHLAAQSYPTVSWKDPVYTMDTNAGGTIAIFEAIKKIRAAGSGYDPMVVVACSSAEYGSTLEKLEDRYVREEDTLLPLHPYGVSKVAQDLLAYQYFMNDGIRTIRARIFNTTGTRKANDVLSDFVRRAVEQERLHTEAPILKVGNIHTHRAIMDFKDMVSALVLLARKGEPGEVYNISAEKAYRIADLITKIEQQTNMHFEIQVDPALLRSTDEPLIIGDSARLKQRTGWAQAVPMEETIAEMLDYWRGKAQ